MTDGFLDGLAREVPGLDPNTWNARRTGYAFEAELEEAQSGARSSGIDSTPTLVVDGPDGEKKLTGEDGPEEISAAIREVGGSGT